MCIKLIKIIFRHVKKLWLQKLKKFISSLFYPAKCPFCQNILKAGELLCENCKDGLPLRSIFTELELDYSRHIDIISAFYYEGKIKDAICNFKFKARLDYADFFAESIKNALKLNNKKLDFDFVSCVPMSKKHKKERGFNQASVLAKKLSEVLDIPFLETVAKVKETKTQHMLSKAERLVNIKGAFSVLNKKSILGKSFLFCDDILTTGSTMKECALVLYDSGVKEILGITVAKTK